MSDDIVLSVNGRTWKRWSEIKIERALNVCASSFEIEVTEKWAGVGGENSTTVPWQIRPFDPCTITIGGKLALTGYVEHYEPLYDKNSHTVRIAGRSKTCDIVDCMPDIAPFEYDGSKLDGIARGIAGKFGVDVSVECDVGDAFPTVVVEPTETAQSIIEKLARQRSVILTDNAQGQLVLTQAGKKGRAASLTEGANILVGSAKIAGNERYSDYVVLSQTPLSYDDDEGHNEVFGHSEDPSVPRHRRFAELAEIPLFGLQARARAKWRALHQFGISTEANITVYGYRQQPGGDLWDVNATSHVKSPRLALDGDLLIGKITYHRDNEAGSRAIMELAPPGAYTPDPDDSIDNSDAFYRGAVKITGHG